MFIVELISRVFVFVASERELNESMERRLVTNLKSLDWPLDMAEERRRKWNKFVRPAIHCYAG